MFDVKITVKDTCGPFEDDKEALEHVEMCCNSFLEELKSFLGLEKPSSYFFEEPYYIKLKELSKEQVKQLLDALTDPNFSNGWGFEIVKVTLNNFWEK